MLDVAIKAAKEAGKILKERFHGSNPVTLKEDRSFLTESDTLSEKTIISIIKEDFPDHSINAEESGFSDQKSDYIWLIDPLDGTTNYATGLPFFAVSIALLEKDVLKIGVVYDPIHNYLYTAEKDKGAYLNGQKMYVSKQEDPSKAMVGYARPSANKGEFVRVFSKVETVTRTPKILGSMALQLSLVASGVLDATILIRPNPWDAAAGVLLVEESGGLVTDFYRSSWFQESENVLASNGKVHNEILEIFKNES